MSKSNTVYLKSGLSYRPTDKDSLNINDQLPVGTYTVKFNQLENYFFLAVVNDFEIGSKIYGNTEERARRILRTFNDRPNSTGVLLAGDKGSGKTQLAKLISAIGGEEGGLITILVNEAYGGEAFNQFIQSISQPSVIIFDEFEKVYQEERGLQDQILTILDGVYPSKKLFIATINETHRISDYMLNRPGRFFYKYTYGRLGEDVIQEYCEDNLVDKSYLDKIISFSSITNVFSFDILKAIVEELNRYGGDFGETVAPLNISVDTWARSYIVTDVVLKPSNKLERPPIAGSWTKLLNDGRPVSVTDSVYVRYGYIVKDSDGDYEDSDTLIFTFNDTKSYEAKSGKIVYETDDVIVTVEPKPYSKDGFDIFSAL